MSDAVTFEAAVLAMGEHLPKGWTAHVKHDGRWACPEGILSGPQGMEVSILQDRIGNRPYVWQARGEFPRSRPAVHPQIAQTWTRAPKTLAGDLSRRLIDLYAQSFAALAKIDAEHDAQDARRAALMREVAQALPGTLVRDQSHPHPNSRPELHAHWSGRQRAQCSGQPAMRVSSWVGDHWQMQLSGLSAQLVLGIAAYLAACEAANAELPDKPAA